MATVKPRMPVSPVALAPGAAMPSESVGPISRPDLVRYAGASGDFNQIHYDEPFAQAAGLPSVFAMGMLHAGILGARLARWVGPNNIRTYSVRFAGQVWPGDELTFHGRVTEIAERDGRPVAIVDLRVTRQNGDEVLTGSADVLVDDAS